MATASIVIQSRNPVNNKVYGLTFDAAYHTTTEMTAAKWRELDQAARAVNALHVWTYVDTIYDNMYSVREELDS